MHHQNCLFLANGCVHYGTVLHEFIHAFGFTHEQNRPDRDGYVRIMWQNIKKDPRIRFNFMKAEGSLTFTPYDGHSIMHYFAKNSFAIEKGLDTIRSQVCAI